MKERLALPADVRGLVGWDYMPSAFKIVISRADFTNPDADVRGPGRAHREVNARSNFFTMLQDSRPDVVVLDLTRDDEQAYKAIRTIRRRTTVPILVVHRQDDARVDDFRACGAAGCISAPLEVFALDTAIQRIIDRNDYNNSRIVRKIPSVTQEEAYQEVVDRAAASVGEEKAYLKFLLRILKPRAPAHKWRSFRLIEVSDLGAAGPFWRRLSPSVVTRADAPRLYQFDSAEVLSHGGFVVGDTAVDEFLFSSEPNWRKSGMAPVVVDETPVQHYDVQLDRVYISDDGPVERVSGPHYWLGTPFALVNFGHFVHDLAAQLIHVDRAKLLYGPHLKFVAAAFLAPGFAYPIQEFLFREFFGPIEDIVFHREGRLEVESLCAGSPVFWLKGHGARGISREALRHLSTRIRNRFASLRRTGAGRRIYITRDDGLVHRFRGSNHFRPPGRVYRTTCGRRDAG